MDALDDMAHLDRRYSSTHIRGRQSRLTVTLLPMSMRPLVLIAAVMRTSSGLPPPCALNMPVAVLVMGTPIAIWRLPPPEGAGSEAESKMSCPELISMLMPPCEAGE